MRLKLVNLQVGLYEDEKLVGYVSLTKIKLGIIEDSLIIKKFYEDCGFVHTGTQKFEHLPFTVGYMEWNNN